MLVSRQPVRAVKYPSSHALMCILNVKIACIRSISVYARMYVRRTFERTDVLA
jgi:hypothetical protein